MPLSAEDRRDLERRIEKLERALEELKGREATPAAPEIQRDELLSFLPASYGQPGVVVNEAQARASGCVEYDIGGATLTFSQEGIAGALDESQRALFCPTLERRELPPAQRERYQALRGARDACRAQLAERPPDGDPVTPWLKCLYLETSQRGYKL